MTQLVSKCAWGGPGIKTALTLVSRLNATQDFVMMNYFPDSDHYCKLPSAIATVLLSPPPLPLQQLWVTAATSRMTETQPLPLCNNLSVQEVRFFGI